jgi:cyclophilin family peptidyl-prolyl cis-trans isomerase
MKRGAVLAVALSLAAPAGLLGCSRSHSGGAERGQDGSAAALPGTADAGGFDPLAVARAEDLRRARDVGGELRTSHDVAARRRSVRALARIADTPSLEALMAALADEDGETVAWAAYGLGFACKGHEDAYVKALAARAASLGPELHHASHGHAEVDPFVSVARAIGRCGASSTSEQLLVSFLKAPSLAKGGVWEEPALLGLGDLVSRKKQLGADAMTALLEAASRKEDPADGAFYALSRADAGEAFGRRVVDVAKAALARPGEMRLLAIKTLARAGRAAPKDVAPELRRVVEDAKGFTATERAEAARALGTLAEPGQSAAADALLRLTPDKGDALAVQALSGPGFHVLYTLIASLGPEPPKKVEPALNLLANLTAPSEPKPGLALRIALLRCSAALGLARGAYDAEVLRSCDKPESETSQRARLTSLLRRPIEGDRKAAFRAFARSDLLRVREQAVEAIGDHPELRDLGASLLAEALASKKSGLVATAAEVVHAHPERVMVLAESEKRAALDPRAPPPSTNPAQEVSKEIGKALAAALADKWPEDRFETRIAVMEAAGVVGLPQAKAAATAACGDPNPVIRERAQKTLREIGESVAACNAPPREPTLAPEIGKTLTKPATLVLTTAAGELRVILEPDLAPVTATRLATLASTGFFKGIVVHRVVPGFVVQLGDPDGDGYGGSGNPLRCETSPVPFEPLDVGMALAGRDTGSSQFFVTLSRTPHLDGEYTRVGRAEGDWDAVVQGDVVSDARLVE